jgi:hypothetical protein
MAQASSSLPSDNMHLAASVPGRMWPNDRIMDRMEQGH